VLATDLAERVPRVGIPVCFLHGVHDYTVSCPLARAYYERLEAPVKGFYTFHHAHSPLFEEPERTCRIGSSAVETAVESLVRWLKDRLITPSPVDVERPRRWRIEEPVKINRRRVLVGGLVAGFILEHRADASAIAGR
jgi:hypothetical protein